MKHISIYVMTAVEQNRLRHAWGAVVVDGGKTDELVGASMYNTTPLAMELTAITQALARVRCACDIDIYSEFAVVSDFVCTAQTLAIPSDSPESKAWKQLFQTLNDGGPVKKLTWRQINDQPENKHIKRCKALAASAVLGQNPAAATADKPAEDGTHSVPLSDGDIETLRIALCELGSKYRHAQLPTAASQCFSLESRLKDIQFEKNGR